MGAGDGDGAEDGAIEEEAVALAAGVAGEAGRLGEPMPVGLEQAPATITIAMTTSDAILEAGGRTGPSSGR